MLLCAVLIALTTPAISKSPSKATAASIGQAFDNALAHSKSNSKQEIESLLRETKNKKASRGAKEIFVYNPKQHASNNKGPVGPNPDDAVKNNSEEDDDKATIRPNFENAELENLINFVAQLTKINVIPTKDTQGVKVSLNMRTNLTKKEVWEVFLTVIEMAGFTINKAGNVYKVLRQDAKKTEPLPAYINVPASSLPETDASVRFVTFLRNIQASDVESLLRGMLGTGGELTRQDNVNAFIITDKCNNIKSAMTILNELDNAELREVIVVLPLKKTDATEVKKLLDEMTKNAGDKSNNAIVARLLGKTQESSEYFSAATKIIVEERSNSLILMGNQKSIKKVEDFIATYIECDDKGTVESPIHRYQLEYSDARDMKDLLDAIVNAQTDSGAERYGGVRSGGKYFKRMRFEIDKDNNALLVSCIDKSDWKMLKKTIRDLDKPKMQVAIETLIVDIDLQDNKEAGGQIRAPRADQPFPNIGWQSAAIAPVVLGGATGAKHLLGDLGSVLGSLAQGTTAFALTKAAGGVWAVFNILNKTFNTSLVDNSFMTVANRVKGSFSSGEQRRVVSQVYSGYSGQTPSYETKKAATSFDYTPQINPDGLVNLNINITMSEFNSDSSTTNKTFKSTLACADGQVLVLGGFVKTKASESTNEGFPLLSQIPLIGWLFKYKTRRVAKTYTFFFICPTVLRTRKQPGTDLYTKMKLHRAHKDVEASILTGATKDPLHNTFFNPNRETYHHKIEDFANARFQPSTIDIRHDPFYNPGIADATNKDFKDEYEGNAVVQKMIAAQVAAEAPSNTPTDEPTEPEEQQTATPELTPQAPPEISEQKTSGSTSEKRAKLKELLATEASTGTTSRSLQEQRDAFKKLLGVNETEAGRVLDKIPPTSKEQSTEPVIKKQPSFNVDRIAKLIQEQQDKKAKLKEVLSLGDKNAEHYQGSAIAKRKNLKELLASYSTNPMIKEASNNEPSSTVSVKGT